MSIDPTHIRRCPPCHGDCRQGRMCDARAPIYSPPADLEERPTAGVQLTYAVVPVLFVGLIAWIALGCPGVM